MAGSWAAPGPDFRRSCFLVVWEGHLNWTLVFLAGTAREQQQLANYFSASFGGFGGIRDWGGHCKLELRCVGGFLSTNREG